MKTIKILIPLFFLILSSYSCNDDYLDQEFYGEKKDENFWKSKTDIEQAINGAVKYLDVSYGYYSLHFLLMEDATTDYFIGGASNAGQYHNFSEWRTSYPTTFSWAIWSPMWQSIYYSNLVLERLDRIPNLTETERKRYEGQARFFRALNYYVAQNNFGGVPIVTSADDSRKEILKSSREEVRKLVEADLIAAAALLPSRADVKTEGQLSRPSKQAALGLLARLYLNWNPEADGTGALTDRWKKVSDACDGVINDPSGLGLEAPYSRIFALDNENNKEIVYGIEHSNASNQTGVFLLNTFFYTPSFPNDPTKDIEVPTASLIGYGGDWKVTRALYDSFDNLDKRKEQLYITYKTKSGNPTRPIPFPFPASALVKKYPLDPNNLRNSTGGNDQPIIRYADIILMKAEAQNHLGNLGDAIALVNQIRTRAGLGDLLSPHTNSDDNLNTYIYHERRREFFCEGLGRTDMIRFGTFLPWIATKPNTDGGNSKYLLFPFDGLSIDKNRALKQNPGYLN